MVIALCWGHLIKRDQDQMEGVIYIGLGLFIAFTCDATLILK